MANSPLQSSRAYLISQRQLLNQEISNKQKNLRTLNQKFTMTTEEFQLERSFFDYANGTTIFLVSNNKAIFKLQKTLEFSV